MSRFQILSWLLSHAKDSSAISALVTQLIAAQDLAEKWSIIKAIGDIIAADLVDYPKALHSAEEGDESLVHSECVAAFGDNFSRILPILTELLPLILKLLGK